MSGKVCGWCREPRRVEFYRGKRENRCACSRDYRTPIEIRRDAVLEKYGDNPEAYTPAVLKELAERGPLDLTEAFCPAGKLSMAETLRREAQGMSAGTAKTPKAVEGEARQPGPKDAPNV